MKFANSLQGKTKSSDSVQTLKVTDGSWARTPEAKAEFLSGTFARTLVVPVGESNEFFCITAGRSANHRCISTNTDAPSVPGIA